MRIVQVYQLIHAISIVIVKIFLDAQIQMHWSCDELCVHKNE